ncbi:MAG TPA: DUF6770 family protein, partial [Flavisolibacter sp.]|nr:DUF6770 family protein [Flavisolibacter sp.]
MKIAILFCCIITAAIAQAQSKVFKEVSDEISSQMKIITQDDALIGYLVFTQLERANKDSFNYKIAIMDENLNDIGTVNFKEENLELQDVSFEQDMLCLAYLKSNIRNTKGANMRAFRKAVNDATNSVFTQFINLQGKIIQSGSYNVDLKTSEGLAYERGNSGTGIVGTLKHNIVLKNIPQKGFTCFYGDEYKNKLLAFDIKGNPVWKKDIPDAEAFSLLTSGTNVYLLAKKKAEMLEGGYEVRGFNVMDGAAYDKYVLRDKK